MLKYFFRTFIIFIFFILNAFAMTILEIDVSVSRFSRAVSFPSISFNELFIHDELLDKPVDVEDIAGGFLALKFVRIVFVHSVVHFPT